jgi:hypothetical protein
MYRILLFFLLSHLAMSALGQVITGRILDQETREPVPLASVFFNGTFVGTSADESGRFELDVSEYFTKPLTISAVGYYPHVLEHLASGHRYTILLERDLYEIEEATISGRDIARKRKEYMRLFKLEFLGRTSRARRCYIMNEEDITFNYQSDKDTLRAMTRKPLRIENDALGYCFTYHLENFVYDKSTKTVSYRGSIIFTRDLAEEGIRTFLYQRRRNLVYRGSTTEFIRKLWSESLKSSGYTLRDYTTGDLMTCQDVVMKDAEGQKYLKYPGELEIQYSEYISTMKLLEPEVRIDRDGFFDPSAIQWSGRMAISRMADFLPYEYSLDR